MGDIAAQVQNYLDRTEDTFPPGSDLYYARKALFVALNSYKHGHFGIGAVAVVRSGNAADLFYGENGMAKPNAIIEHAEIRALLRIAAGETPDHTIKLAKPSQQTATTYRDEIETTVYGTIEPCPMCACAMTNAGVRRSVSTCMDGKLERNGDYLVSSGAANVLADKYETQPQIWRDIQQIRGLRFELLTPTNQELHDLSWGIMTASRNQVDQVLATRPPLGTKRS